MDNYCNLDFFPIILCVNDFCSYIASASLRRGSTMGIKERKLKTENVLLAISVTLPSVRTLGKGNMIWLKVQRQLILCKYKMLKFKFKMSDF